MLDGQPVVFLSCSERYKDQVAVPIRAALAAQGVRGIIVSEEPRLPGQSDEPDGKVNSYLDASDGFVALCTPDDQLQGGSFHTRQNIINEWERARSRPLRGKIQVFKAPAVELPTNLNPVYDPLNLHDPASIAEEIMSQLRTWGVLGREPEPAPAPSVAPPATAAEMINGLELGDQGEAEGRAYELLNTQSRQSQAAAVEALAAFLRQTSSEGGDEVHRAGSVLEAINRLDPSLVSDDLIEELANSGDFAKRSIAATLLWDRAEVAPHEVPLGLLGRLALPSTEDWYVQAPAMAAAKQLLLHRRSARIIFDRLAASNDFEDRYEVAAALLDVARVDPNTVPRDLAELHARDEHELVATQAQELVRALGPRSEDEGDPRSPFGL
jgi:hypothetical protein